MPGLVEVYNLSPSLRSALQTPSAAIQVRAGWSNTKMTLLFAGGVQAAWSRREGPDIITSITCLSGLVTESQAISDNLIFSAGTSVQAVLLAAAAKFSGVVVDPKNVSVKGSIGRRGYTMHGLVSDCLTELAHVYGFHWAIIDGSFYAVMDYVPLPGNAVDIGPDSGLMRAEPILYSDFQIQSGIIIYSLLNPWVQPNRVINLKSEVNPALNGSYLSWSVTHCGDTHTSQWETISETTLVNFSQGAGF